jgi:hypothetical protein
MRVLAHDRGLTDPLVHDVPRGGASAVIEEITARVRLVAGSISTAHSRLQNAEPVSAELRHLCQQTPRGPAGSRARKPSE